MILDALIQFWMLQFWMLRSRTVGAGRRVAASGTTRPAPCDTGLPADTDGSSCGGGGGGGAHQPGREFIGSSHMTSPAAICKGFVTASLLKSYGHQIKSLCFITQLSLHAMFYINSKFLGNMF